MKEIRPNIVLGVYETMHEKELEKRKQKAFAKEGADKLDYYVEAVHEEEVVHQE